MLRLRLSRVYYEEDGVFSNLHAPDSSLVCVTLEHSYAAGKFPVLKPEYRDAPQAWLPKVPPGVFYCRRGVHQLHHGDPFETFEVTGVVGHSGILFHRGNFNEDSEGCLLTGEYSTSAPNPKAGGKVCDLVVNTVPAFEAFLKATTGVDIFELEVIS